MIARTLAALIILASLPARAMEYSIGDDPSESRFIYATGTIEENEARRFRQFLAAQAPWKGKTFLALNSSGGLVDDAMALARIVERSQFLTSVGPEGHCTSSCVLVWAAGKRKFTTANGCVGVHNAFTTKDKVTATWSAATREKVATQATGVMARWLSDHGAPANVTIQLLHTPSTSIYCLTPDDLAAWSVKIVDTP